MVRLRVAIPLVGGLAVLGAGAVAMARHLAGGSMAHQAEGGILMGNARFYDRQTRFLKGSLFKGIAADVSDTAAELEQDAARVLDVGCGPGHLSLRMARDPHLQVTGVDLDPAMVERAQANTRGEAAEIPEGATPPSFMVGNVAELPFDDGSFDIVVSTMSMHHWSDVPGGLAEIARVLRPNGRALIWDMRPGMVPLHRRLPDPVAFAQASPLELVDARPWRWPWRFSFLQRVELQAPWPTV